MTDIYTQYDEISSSGTDSSKSTLRGRFPSHTFLNYYIQEENSIYFSILSNYISQDLLYIFSPLDMIL